MTKNKKSSFINSLITVIKTASYLTLYLLLSAATFIVSYISSFSTMILEVSHLTNFNVCKKAFFGLKLLISVIVVICIFKSSTSLFERVKTLRPLNSSLIVTLERVSLALVYVIFIMKKMKYF